MADECELPGVANGASGTLEYFGPARQGAASIELVSYDAAAAEARPLAPGDAKGLAQPPDRSIWLRLSGVHDLAAVCEVGERFGLGHLLIEDICNTYHRPKLEILDDIVFLTCKAAVWPAGKGAPRLEQVSIAFGPGWVATFQEAGSTVLDGVRRRLLFGRGRLRAMDTAYLALMFLDEVVDGYLPVLDRLEDEIEELEEALTRNMAKVDLLASWRLRRVTLSLRRALWPLKEICATLRHEEGFLDERHAAFVRDVSDHVLFAADALETSREMLSGLLEIAMTAAGMRMNAVMKVLTVIATIFIPLTFIAGVYGMNFEHMPELRMPWGYPMALGLMLAVALGMLYFFKRKDWL